MKRRIAVLVFCYNRSEYLERALNSLLKYLPATYSLIVSQDANDTSVAALLARPEHHDRVLHVQYVQGRVDWRQRGMGTKSTDYFISSHYRNGLRCANAICRLLHAKAGSCSRSSNSTLSSF